MIQTFLFHFLPLDAWAQLSTSCAKGSIMAQEATSVLQIPQNIVSYRARLASYDCVKNVIYKPK